MRVSLRHPLTFLAITLLLCIQTPALTAAEESDPYNFNVQSFTKKTWEWKGAVTLTGTSKQYNTDSAVYAKKFQGTGPGQSTEGELNIFLESRWDWDVIRLVLSAEASAFRSSLADTTEDSTFLSEGYLQLARLDPHTVEFGKRLLRWGKGYAFNPVAFLERPKNPEDPEANREGVVVSQGIWIAGKKLFLDNSSATVVYFPVRDGINDDFRDGGGHENGWGLKLYGLISTTDIGLYLVRWPEAEETDWGVDVAANLTSSFEVHGEHAVFASSAGTTRKSLLGLRYLSENEVTWILEGFHDTSGLTSGETAALYETLATGTSAQARSALARIQQSRTLSQSYGFLKISVKEPFNWLYFTPSASWLVNLDDASHTATVQATYVPLENWTLQATWQQARGTSHTQWGENPVGNRISLELVRNL